MVIYFIKSVIKSSVPFLYELRFLSSPASPAAPGWNAGRRQVWFVLEERLTLTRCLPICSAVPLQSLRRRRAARMIAVVRSPRGLYSCQLWSRDRGVFMVRAVFVLKSSFARRQSIYVVSLFLVLARVGALFSDRGEDDSAQRQLFFFFPPLASLNLASPVWERKRSFHSLRSLFQRRDFSHLHSLLRANFGSLGSHMALSVLPVFVF